MTIDSVKLLFSFYTRKTTLDVEIACLDISPLGENITRSELVAVGLWTDISCRILRIPDLSEAMKEPLGGGLYIRNIKFSKLKKTFFRNYTSISSDDKF